MCNIGKLLDKIVRRPAKLWSCGLLNWQFVGVRTLGHPCYQILRGSNVGKKTDVKILHLVDKIRCLRKFRRLFRDGCFKHTNLEYLRPLSRRSGHQATKWWDHKCSETRRRHFHMQPERRIEHSRFATTPKF